MLFLCEYLRYHLKICTTHAWSNTVSPAVTNVLQTRFGKFSYALSFVISIFLDTYNSHSWVCVLLNLTLVTEN